MLVLFLSFATVGWAACGCSAPLHQTLLSEDNVMRIRIAQPATVSQYDDGGNQPRVNVGQAQNLKAVYENVKILNIYKGGCLEQKKIRIEQILDSCPDRQMHPAGTPDLLTDIDVTDQTVNSGIYYVGGALRTTDNIEFTLFLDPCAVIFGDRKRPRNFKRSRDPFLRHLRLHGAHLCEAGQQMAAARNGVTLDAGHSLLSSSARIVPYIANAIENGDLVKAPTRPPFKVVITSELPKKWKGTPRCGQGIPLIADVTPTKGAESELFKWSVVKGSNQCGCVIRNGYLFFVRSGDCVLLASAAGDADNSYGEDRKIWTVPPGCKLGGSAPKCDSPVSARLSDLDLTILSMPEGRTTITAPRLLGGGNTCFFKSERPMEDKEDNVCGSAGVSGCTKLSPPKVSFRSYVQSRLLLERDARSRLSYGLSLLARSTVNAPNFAVFKDVRGTKQLLGNCMLPPPARANVQWAQVQKAYEPKVRIVAAKKVNDVYMEFTEPNMQRKMEPQPDLATDAVEPLGDTGFLLVATNIKGDAGTPCAGLRADVLKRFQEQAANAKFNPELGMSYLEMPEDFSKGSLFQSGFLWKQEWSSPVPQQIPSPVDPQGVPTPNFDRFFSDVLELQLLDNIAGQTDRNAGNVFFRSPLTKGGSNVFGIDLDMAFGNRLSAFLQPSFDHAQLRDKPPYVTKRVFRKIMSITTDSLWNMYEPESLAIQEGFYMVIARLKQVQDHLRELERLGKVLSHAQIMTKFDEFTHRTSYYHFWVEAAKRFQAGCV